MLEGATFTGVAVTAKMAYIHHLQVNQMWIGWILIPAWISFSYICTCFDPWKYIYIRQNKTSSIMAFPTATE